MASTSKFAVLVHGHDLLVKADDGSFAPGGVFTWRCVRAMDRDDAVRAAIRLVSDETSAERDRAGGAAWYEAEEVIHLDEDDDRHGTGLVFYANVEIDA